MSNGPSALVWSVNNGPGHAELEVPITDGRHFGVVSWDRVRCTYRAEVDLFAPPSGVRPLRARSVDAFWTWLAAPEPEALPGRVVIGHRSVELLTVDSLVNRLAAVGFHPDAESVDSLFALRSEVRARCGSVVFLGRSGSGASDSSPRCVTAELLLGLPAGATVPLRPPIDHPEHGFGWGQRAAATVRTASVMVEVAWAPWRDAATEAAVIDLAVSVLADVRGGFTWRVESVADWIATETGELADVGRASGPPESGEGGAFRQLSFEFR